MAVPKEKPAATPNPLTLTMSLSMKVNLGNYESAEAFVSIQGVGVGTTKEQVEEILDQPARISYEALRDRMRRHVSDLYAGVLNK